MVDFRKNAFKPAFAVTIAVSGNTTDRNESSPGRSVLWLLIIITVYNNNRIWRTNSYERTGIRVEGHVAVFFVFFFVETEIYQDFLRG